jgi:Flp pilus assembly protein TadD
LKDIDFITAVKPDTLPALVLKGMIKTKQRRYAEAAAVFAGALQFHPDNDECAINLATVLYYQHAWDSAEHILKEVIQHSATEPTAFNTLGMIHVSKGDTRQALSTVNKAIGLKRDPYFINNRGYIYLQLNLLDSALADINESIRLDADNPWAYRNKGIYYLRTSDYPSAVRLLKQAIEMDPFVEDGFAYLAEALLQNQQTDEACKAWQESVARAEGRSVTIPGCTIKPSAQ